MPTAPIDLTQWKGATPPDHRTLQGRYVRLEALDVAKHCSQLWLAFQTDPKLWDYMPSGPFATETDFEQYLTWRNTSNDPMFYTVVDLATGEAQGLITYLRITPPMGSIEIGHIAFGGTMQRTRKATEAVFLLADEAFNVLGYRRLEWKCNNANARSKRAAERFGFQFEGIFRQHMVVKGKSRDSAWFSIVDGEWPALRQAYLAWLSPENFDDNAMEKSKLQSFVK